MASPTTAQDWRENSNFDVAWKQISQNFTISKSLNSNSSKETSEEPTTTSSASIEEPREDFTQHIQ